ncbi:Ger(x)C family spore germination protein [Ammoniphilus resinae]|uniref:Spore germination protein KC n=1 Tax=Ammoniphilus resinae TaxID=861532 RepID=A0ABS4GVK9_9BACL|nr:Ger(x)C family spore germination protein [Ammoniphilus resinae]MBP1934310.1 spore germination protein KC [Ammoniphilus resinae]
MRGFKLLMVCLFFLLAGCGYKDIDKRFFVVAIGVDKSNSDHGKYKITFKVAIPPDKPSAKSNEAEIITTDSDSMTEAVRITRAQLDKEIDFSHTKAIIFGQSLVQKENVSEIIDWFVRRRDIQRIAYTGVGSPTALEVLKVRPAFERLPGNSLFLYFGRSGTEAPYVITEPLFDFYRRIKEKGIDPVLPIIQAEGDKYSILSSAIFKNYRMNLTLNDLESEILNSFLGRLKKTDFKIQANGESFFVFADSVKLNYDLLAGEKPTIHIHCKMSVTIEESKQTLALEKMHQLQILTEQEIRKNVLKLVKKFQQANVDPIGFGLRYRGSHLNNQTEWQKWEDIYPEIEFTMKAEVKVRGTGSIY